MVIVLMIISPSAMTAIVAIIVLIEWYRQYAQTGNESYLQKGIQFIHETDMNRLVTIRSRETPMVIR